MYLGLDLGTSGLKGVIVNDVGEVVASHNASLTVSRPQAGWSEQNPQDWVDAARDVLATLRPHLPFVRAIGLSGQMHGATCLDKSGAPLRPAILWNDTRAAKEAAALDENAELKAIFGNITFPGFTAPKILWMKHHEPAIYAKIDKVLLPKDYLRFWLSGELLSDLSDASGTAWLDIGKRDWSDELLAASGLRREHMPRLVEGSEVSSQLRQRIAEDFGFSDDVIIAGGAGDNAATAMGLDIVAPGNAFVSLGTSGVVFAANDSFQPDTASALHAFCHAIPARWHQMGVTLSATDCLNWFARQFDAKPADLVNQLGAFSTPSSELFMPFLGGERTPYNSATLRASFHNISHDTDRAALTRAVLEGVCFSLKTCFDLMEQSAGRIDAITAVGGGAQSDYWLSLLATIFNRAVMRPVGAENAAAIGAARLGAMALGADFPLSKDAACFEPQAIHDAYLEKFKAYTATINRSDL